MLDRRATDLGSDLLGALEVQVREQHAVAVGREPPRDRRAEPARRARDDGCPRHYDASAWIALLRLV